MEFSSQFPFHFFPLLRSRDLLATSADIDKQRQMISLLDSILKAWSKNVWRTIDQFVIKFLLLKIASSKLM